MVDISKIDYSTLDRPEILALLFHPRPEWSETKIGGAFEDLLIPVEKEVVIGSRFHLAGRSMPNILFFHGNGEIVADYDDLGHIYRSMGINFLPVDYRGYGRSTGEPTITAMMRDSHVIFNFVTDRLAERGYNGPFFVMGRSLGSASALEISSHYADLIDGLIIESGFANIRPLLELLGVNMEALGIREEEGVRNIDKIRGFEKPALIIHAENDHIIPYSEGQALYEACAAQDKRLLKIPDADHNNIFFKGMSEYMEAIKELIERVK
ncbi:MAG: alpha/beta hydrolase [Deltaproteobacteria bacterium]|nr:alpha/beta hydrolase [Deltaproteobacteria bacterium]